MFTCKSQLFLRFNQAEGISSTRLERKQERKRGKSPEHRHVGAGEESQATLRYPAGQGRGHPTRRYPTGQGRGHPTKRSTMLGLLFLRVFTAWKTSTVLWCRSISQTMLMAQNEPLRPPPFLSEKKSDRWSDGVCRHSTSCIVLYCICGDMSFKPQRKVRRSHHCLTPYWFLYKEPNMEKF